MKNAFPSYSNSFIALAQDTSLAFTVGIVDMMGRAQILQSRTGRGFEAYVVVGVIYILITVCMHVIAQLIIKIINNRERESSS